MEHKGYLVPRDASDKSRYINITHIRESIPYYRLVLHIFLNHIVQFMSCNVVLFCLFWSPVHDLFIFHDFYAFIQSLLNSGDFLSLGHRAVTPAWLVFSCLELPHLSCVCHEHKS